MAALLYTAFLAMNYYSVTMTSMAISQMRAKKKTLSIEGKPVMHDNDKEQTAEPFKTPDN